MSSIGKLESLPGNSSVLLCSLKFWSVLLISLPSHARNGYNTSHANPMIWYPKHSLLGTLARHANLSSSSGSIYQ